MSEYSEYFTAPTFVVVTTEGGKVRARVRSLRHSPRGFGVCRFSGPCLRRCRVASRNFATGCLIQNVTHSPGMRDLERYIALGCWPRR